MKIAICYNLPFGGAKRAMYELVKRLVKHHTVDFYRIGAADKDGLDIDQLVNQVTSMRGPARAGGLGMITSLYPLRAAYAEIAGQINRGGYDLAFVSQCEIAHTPYLLLFLKIPSLYYCHEPGNRHLEPQVLFQGRLGFLKKAFLSWRFKHVDRPNICCATIICANSRYTMETIYRAYGLFSRYCPLGVDVDLFRPLNLPRTKEILVVGSLTASKASDFVIESVGTMTDRPAVRFIFNFSHKTTPQNRLTERAQELGVTIHFENLVSDDNLVKAYNRAAIVAVASYLEPMGFVPLEAFACGTPVVGVAEAGIRETVHDGITGLLTERDSVEFGRALGKIMNDEAMRLRMGEAGRRYVLENRTWDQSYAYLERNMPRAIAKYNENHVH